MSRYQKYPAYKDSGVEWIGEIPEHWEITKIRYYYDVQLGKMLQPESKTETDVEVKYLKAQHVQWNVVNHDDLPTMWASEKEIEKFAVQQGDLLICEGGEVGRSALLDGVSDVCIIQNALHRVRAKEKSSVKYLQYFMQHVSNARWFDILCNKATIAHLTGEKLAALELPVPPVHEQQAIASFLDSRTEKIDELIAKKESLLNKLHEKSIALIIQAVTKGLDLSVPMKESGVNWIGKIPEHWEVKRGRFTMQVNPQSPIMRTLNEESEVSFIAMDAVNEYGGLCLDQTRIKSEVSGGYTEFQEGDVVVAKITPCFENGKGGLAISLVNSAAFGTTELHVLRPIECLDNRFLFFLTITDGFRKLGESTMYGAGGQKRVPPEFCKNFHLPLPSITEQRVIVKQIEKKTVMIDRQKQQITEAIERLKEYRSALITDAVTGKMDVHSYETKESFLPEQKRI